MIHQHICLSVCSQVDGFFTLLFGLASINTLTVISISRYIKGCHPNKGQLPPLCNQVLEHLENIRPACLPFSHSSCSHLTEKCVFRCHWHLITDLSCGNNYHLSPAVSFCQHVIKLIWGDIFYFQVQLMPKNVLIIWKLGRATVSFVSGDTSFFVFCSFSWKKLYKLVCVVCGFFFFVALVVKQWTSKGCHHLNYVVELKVLQMSTDIDLDIDVKNAVQFQIQIN